jgi:predicted CXXCH cytochrome family protein
MISLRSLGLKLLAIAVAVALASAHGHAQTALSSSFNHFLTGFPLTGTHSSVDCASCHVNGRFKGTPRQCFACHNSATAAGKSQAHPQTTNLCESCHLTATWREVRFIDHTQATLVSLPTIWSPLRHAEIAIGAR